MLNIYYSEMYVYLPQIFIGFCLFVLFIFLYYDRNFAYIYNTKTEDYVVKKLNFNRSLLFIVFVIFIFGWILLNNNYSVIFDGESFSKNLLGEFTEKYFLVVCILSLGLLETYAQITKGISSEFYFFYYFLVVSSLMLIHANNFVAFYILIELQSIALYLLVAFDRSSSLSSESGLKYFLVSIFMSILFLLGVALIYLTFGTTNFSSLSLLMYNLSDFSLATYGYLLVFVFVFFKLALVPFHFWALDVYKGASWPVFSMLLVVTKIPLLYFVIRLLFVFSLDVNLNLSLDFISNIFNIVGYMSIIVGSFGALYYSDLRNILLYSGVGNMGYIFLVLGSPSFLSFFSAYFYFIIYSLFTLLFIYLISFSLGSKFVIYTSQLKGLASKYPFESFLMVLCIVNNLGLPPFSGFWIKFFNFVVLVDLGFLLKAIILFIFSIVSFYYYLGIIRNLYYNTSKNEEKWLMQDNANKNKGKLSPFFFVFIILSLSLIFINLDKIIWIILSKFI